MTRRIQLRHDAILNRFKYITVQVLLNNGIKCLMEHTENVSVTQKQSKDAFIKFYFIIPYFVKW